MGEQRSGSSRSIVIAIVIGALIIAVALSVGLIVGLRDHDDDNQVREIITDTSCSSASTGDNSETGGSSVTEDYVAGEFKSAYEEYEFAGVATDSKVCSGIGTDLLARRRGNAIDAAMATLLCTGLVNAHSCGLGGGSFLVVYDKETNQWLSVNSRETAPGAATQDMYVDDMDASRTGGKAIGVPGEIKGIWELHSRLGKLPWAEIVKPSIMLCEDGVPIETALHYALTRVITDELKSSFSEYFDGNGNVLPEGSLVKLPKLAETFRKISDDPHSFYNGSLAQDIVADIADAGGIITLDDLKNYQAKVAAPTELSLPNSLKVYSINAPGSGPVLNYILNILTGYNFNSSSIADTEDQVLTYHRIIEAFKFAYAKRTELGDIDFVNVGNHVADMSDLSYGEETRQQIDDDKTMDVSHYNPNGTILQDAGTAHISVIDGMGSSVAATSTVNHYFGSKVRGSRTGIIFNNEMDDFSTPNTTNSFGIPASPSNFIAPGKRPMSSMSPVIVMDETTGKVRMISGASGGTRITTAVALTLMDVLWFGQSLPEAIDQPRIHHQLVPTEAQIEDGFPFEIAKGLEAKGHETESATSYAVIQAIEALGDKIIAVSDYRKGGKPDGF